MGIDDLGYMGNTVVPKWDGCPPEQLEKLRTLKKLLNAEGSNAEGKIEADEG